MADKNTLTVTLRGDGWGRPGGAGCVYLLHAAIDAGTSGRLYHTYKIGQTTQASIAPRIFAAQRAIGEKVTLLHTIETNHVRWAERWLHDHLAEQRVVREWFELGDTDLAWLQGIYRITAEWRAEQTLPHLAWGWR